LNVRLVFPTLLLTVPVSAMLKTDEKRALLQIARNAIRTTFHDSEPDRPPDECPGLDQAAGVFVSLRLNGKLRGCVGLIETDRPLRDAVGEVARKAAFEDPRFPPLTVSELENTEFEVSILSQIQPLKSLDDIQVGLHGVIVESEMHKGLLLPHIAVECGWSREELISALLRKAGLPSTAATEPGTRFFLFHTERVVERGRELA